MNAEPLLIVDSTVWIDYFRGRQNLQTVWLNQVMDYYEIGMIDLVMAEVLQGAANEREFQLLRRQMDRFRFLETGGQNLAIASAKNYRTLRERGLTVRKTIDCLIATICITDGYVLLHRDRDFDGFEKHLGLSVIHPRFQ